MKIIKEGKTPDLADVQFTCEHCGCIFEATNEEYMLDEVWIGRYLYRYLCNCPTCHYLCYETKEQEYE